MTRTRLFKIWLALTILGGALALSVPAGRIYGHMKERQEWLRNCEASERSGIELAPRYRGFCERLQTSIAQRPNDLAYALTNWDVGYVTTAVLIVWLRFALLGAGLFLTLGWVLSRLPKSTG